MISTVGDTDLAAQPELHTGMAMGNRAFGKTGWRVSQVGLGCWQFGGAIMLDGQPEGWSGISDEESSATIKRAVELGINFFDTADMYGWGRSEEVLGRTLQEIGHRDQQYIATKVGFWRDEQDCRTRHESKNYILNACEASLRRLQTDHIDLYQCHLWHTERWMEFLDAFETLQTQGKIRFYGVSTNRLDLIEHFNERNQLASVQSNYNLLERRVEQDVLPYCREHGIAFIASGPLARGKLSGRFTRNQKFDANDIRNRWLDNDKRKSFERDVDIVDRLKPIAEKYGFTMAEMAVRFVLAQAGVSTTIPGTKNRRQVERNVAASILPPLTQDELSMVHQTLACCPNYYVSNV